MDKFIDNNISDMVDILKKKDELYKKEIELKKKNEEHLKYLESLSADTVSTTIPTKSNVDNINSNNNAKVSEEQDISKYYNGLLKATREEEYEAILPKNNSDFYKIINLVILKIKSDINELYLLLNELEEKEELLNDIAVLEEKIEDLIAYRDLEEIIEEVDESKPTHLLFVKDNNDILFEKHVDKDIPMEMYSLLSKDIENLSKGTYRKYKYVFSAQVHELRRNQLRIYFDRYSNDFGNFIFVIACTQKKSKNDRAFNYQFFSLITQKYNKFKKSIIPILNSENYTDVVIEHEEILGNILKKLDEGYKYERDYK